MEEGVGPARYRDLNSDLPVCITQDFLLTMSDQEFETSREFVILDFLSSLKTLMLQNLPNHFQVLFKYKCQVFLKGELLE